MIYTNNINPGYVAVRAAELQASKGDIKESLNKDIQLLHFLISKHSMKDASNELTEILVIYSVNKIYMNACCVTLDKRTQTPSSDFHPAKHVWGTSAIDARSVYLTKFRLELT